MDAEEIDGPYILTALDKWGKPSHSWEVPGKEALESFLRRQGTDENGGDRVVCRPKSEVPAELWPKAEG